ncbi:MAG: arginine decarboxylase, partial [Phormidesmis sp.]
MSPTYTPAADSTADPIAKSEASGKHADKAPREQPIAATASTTQWTIEDSEELYRIKGWGEPYFSINARGNITVSPQGDRGGSLDLKKLVEGLKQRDFQLPVLIRFSEILADRLERLNACFAKAIAR